MSWVFGEGKLIQGNYPGKPRDLRVTPARVTLKREGNTHRGWNPGKVEDVVLGSSTQTHSLLGKLWPCVNSALTVISLCFQMGYYLLLYLQVHRLFLLSSPLSSFSEFCISLVFFLSVLNFPFGSFFRVFTFCWELLSFHRFQGCSLLPWGMWW